LFTDEKTTAMRKLQLTLLIIAFAFFATGQSLVDTTKLWSTLIQGPPYNPMPDKDTEHIRFEQDTVIDLKTYKKVFRSTDQFQTNWTECCYIRETFEKEVFVIKDNTLQEYLLYDFDANINDTLTVIGVESYMNNWGFISGVAIVDSIDTIYIGNEFRKRLLLNGGAMQWIEGMGSMVGILHNFFGIVGGDWFELLCFTENDTLKYQNPSYNSCYVITDINDNRNTFNVSIFPNPTTGLITIKAEQVESIEVMNIEGRQIYTGKQTQIDISQEPKGIYIIKVTTSKGVAVEKVIKN
jgi:hypothetical protein